MSKVKTQNYNSKFKTDLKYRTYNFSLSIISLVQKLSINRVSLVIIDQLLRAATSVGANIIEAKSASSKRDFVRYYEISLKSANETKYWLCLLRDSKLVEKREITPLLNKIIEISNMTGSSLLTLKGKKRF